MLSFRALFVLVFLGLGFTTLEAVLSFQGVQSRQHRVAHWAVMIFSLSKLVASYLVRFHHYWEGNKTPAATPLRALTMYHTTGERYLRLASVRERV